MKNNITQKNIPQGWKWEILGNIGKCIRGVSYSPKDISAEKNDRNIFLLRSNNIKDSHFNFNDVKIVSNAKVKNDQILQNGDFFICMSNGSEDLVGKNVVYFGEKKYTVGAFCAIYRPNNPAQTKFLTHFFHSLEYEEQIKNALAGTSINNLKNSNIEDLRVLLPSIKEQNRIAEILGSVDEELEKTQEIIKATEKIKQGLMQQLLKSGKKQIIENVAKLNPEQINPLNAAEKKFYYIDIASIKNCAISIPKEFYGKDAPSRARRLVKNKDIIISTVRPNLKGFAYITEAYDNFLCSTGFCVLRSDEIDSKFLYYVISDDKFTEYLVGKTTGSNYPAVNPIIIGEYKFHLPDITEQQKIAEILSAVDEKISINKKLKVKIIKLKKGLMQDLLSGKVRVI